MELQIGMKNYEDSFLASVIHIVDTVISILEQFPCDHVPSDKVGSELKGADFLGTFKEEQEKQPVDEEELQKQLMAIVDTLPDNYMHAFINSGLLVNDAIDVIKHLHPELHFSALFAGLSPDQEQLEELQKTIMLHQAGLDIDQVIGSPGLFTPQMPYNYTLCTLLGPEATKWLQAPSEDMPGKIQPHEASRVNWHLLNNIRTQVKIENELRDLQSIEPFLSKIVVVCAWCIKGLMTVINPNIFTSESKAHISQISDGNLTLSHGIETHTIVNYYPGSFIVVLQVLKKLLVNTLFEAPDMMWIASGLTKIRSINQRHSLLENIPSPEINLFLSHRGKDAKKDLMELVLSNNPNGKFLDCLCLPHRLINRNFVFRNLVNAQRAIILKTTNFSDSIWCQKEEALADYLSEMQLIDVVKASALDEVLDYVANNPGISVKQQVTNAEEHDAELSWTVIRVLRDIDSFNGTRPNIYSLNENDIPTDIFDGTIGFLEKHSDTDPASIQTYSTEQLLEQVESLMNSTVRHLYHHQQIATFEALKKLTVTHDFLCVTAQLMVALLSLRSEQYDKMLARKYLNHINKIVKWILDAVDSEQQLQQLLTFACVSAVLELAGDRYKSIEQNGIAALVDDYGVYKDGLVLIDVRQEYDAGNIMLRLLVELVEKYDIGTAGVLQHGQHPIHELSIDNFSLEVLPCVTFHEGMEGLFEHSSGKTGNNKIKAGCDK